MGRGAEFAAAQRFFASADSEDVGEAGASEKAGVSLFALYFSRRISRRVDESVDE